ncbi:hypothetical protein GGR58DRAFT_516009 [Xylaria digitata]|nr:hypothetical protein GGR58DRAFT_516009 [Xylaria digitata]
MAVPALNSAASIGRVGDIDGDSDYGSDFSVGEEQLVDEILTGLVSGNTVTSTVRTSSTTTAAGQNHNGYYRGYSAKASTLPTGAAVSLTFAQAPSIDTGPAGASRLEQGAVPLGSVEYPDLSSALSSLEPKTPVAQRTPRPTIEKEEDTRTPLERFRIFPRRPLTVSDFAAGAWCELQHWYTLTRLPGGRKTMTAAMKGGSRVHQSLEDEVHTSVQVSITSKEEAFALRLWNIIQGMRTLRETGITRELEVWGTVEGEILNGVIDQLSHNSPNAGFEEELNLPSSNPSTQQSSITDYMGPSHKYVYLTDVKTRGSDRLPSGAAIRPARVQLYLYHRLLSDMAADKVDYSAIFERYGLNGEARFSDGFMAQIGGLHDEIFFDADSDLGEMLPETYSHDFIGYRSISQIIPLLKTELKETFPRGSASISDLLAVEYRHRSDGRFLGHNSFVADLGALDAFMRDHIRWWRGEREPEGVTIEETYKCHWCEFADTCQWRKDKEVEYLKKRKGKANVESSAS